jgi:hypothetical protein
MAAPSNVVALPTAARGKRAASTRSATPKVEAAELLLHAVQHLRIRRGGTLFRCWMQPMHTGLPCRVLVELGMDMAMRFYVEGERLPLLTVEAAEVAAAARRVHRKVSR